ncbi:MAG: hypothetical protein ACKOQL_02650, partial [Actinomycetes bacterium]
FLISFLIHPNLANAAINKLPAPTIGTLLGFYPGGKYTAVSAGGNSSLDVGELIVSYELIVVYLDAGERINAPCGTADNGTVIASARAVSTPQNSTQFLPLATTWNNPANSEFRIVCAFSTYTVKNSQGVISNLKSPISYVTILPTPSSTPSASPSLSVTPTVTPTTITEKEKPSGSKPSVSGTPIFGSKFKISIKSWDMNGNEFVSRSIYLYICNDSECKDVANSFPVVETGTLNFDVAKTLTMSKVVGKAGQYVKAIDTVYYPAPSTNESGEDNLVELSSSIKKIELASTGSASTKPSAEPSVVETVNEIVSEVPSIEPTQSSKESIEVNNSENSVDLSSIVLVFAGLILILLIAIFFILKVRKKKA